MNLHEEQLWSDEQRAVIRRLSELAAKNKCCFLEVGSWCGDSTVVIGQVVKAHDGHLICIDWWKGNPETDLEYLAAKNDIFDIFWQRIIQEGLEDTVVPIRAESGFASLMLKEKSFDMVFLDGDHRYEGVLSDINKFKPLVKDGGILCGHDCEGYLNDFDEDFLIKCKDTDYFQGVHCGVVLAVGESFTDYSVNESIWSVKSSNNGWEAADVKVCENEENRQALIPPLGFIGKYNCYRYKKKICAVPFSNDDNDIRKDIVRNGLSVVSADSIDEIEKILGGNLENLPLLVDQYKHYNLVKYNKRVFGILQGSGDFDLKNFEEEKLKKLIEEKIVVIGNSLGDAIEAIEAITGNKSDPLSELESILNDLGDDNKLKNQLKKIYSEVSDYKFKQIQFIESVENFNIVLIDGRYTAVSKSIGTIDIEHFKINNNNVGDLIFSADNLDDIKEQAKKVSINNYKRTLMINDFEALIDAVKNKKVKKLFGILNLFYILFKCYRNNY